MHAIPYSIRTRGLEFESWLVQVQLNKIYLLLAPISTFEAWGSLVHFVQWNYLFVARKRCQLWIEVTWMKFTGSNSSNLIQQLSSGDWDLIWMDITDTNTSSCFFWGFGLQSQTQIVSDASNIDTILYTYQKSDFEYSDLETDGYWMSRFIYRLAI